MKLSEKRRTAIYAAVSERIMDLRIALAKPATEGEVLGDENGACKRHGVYACRRCWRARPVADGGGI